jgi:guanylate kinase
MRLKREVKIEELHKHMDKSIDEVARKKDYQILMLNDRLNLASNELKELKELK